MSVAVVDKNGVPLMPTNSYRARKLLKSGRAVIYRYRPIFTICITDREGGDTQPVEYKCDTGYQHIGISICSQKHEYVNAQYDMLPDEPERHNDRRKYRRTRRNRKRYRKPRFDNRKGMVSKDGFAPSIRNKRDCHIRLFEQYAELLPITKACFEMGQFDTQLLKAIEEGRPIPQGEGYQHGERYGIETLREAVFTRDGHTCTVCGGSGMLHVHHLGFWKGDWTNRMGNLVTVCGKCHTAKNHKPGGKLYGLQPKLKTFKGATFMTSVRWDMLGRLKTARPDIPLSVTYGAYTKITRKDLGIKKSHSNDAYSCGQFHPVHRADFIQYRKRRRNNRILEKFYDARYLDIRDGSRKSGSQLSCGRTNRRESRHTDKNERIFRGARLSKGMRSIRKGRYCIQPGDVLLVEGNPQQAKGMHCKGTRVVLKTGKSVAAKKVEILHHAGGWVPVQKERKERRSA